MAEPANSSALVPIAGSASGEAHIVPHEGLVFVDKDPFSDEYVLSHKVTGERVTLHGYSDVLAVFDPEDGSCALSARRGQSDDEECLLVDDLLSVEVYRDQEQNTIVVHDGDGPPAYLDSLKFGFMLAKVRIDTSRGRFSALLSAAQLKTPGYYNLRVQWNLHELYDLFRLASYQGRRWNWVSKSMQSWVAYLAAILPHHPDALLRALPKGAGAA